MAKGQKEQVTSRIFTVPNVISFVRLCLVPIYFILLNDGHDIAATVLFAIAAGTDFVDGQIARRTHAVSKIGQVLDPAVDRILMIAGVVGLLMVGRLPIWIVLVVLLRDLFLLCGGAYLLKRYSIRIPVIYPGKFATTFLFVGFAGLLLNWPQIPGLGLTDASWLPGFNGTSTSWGIWFVYAGLLLALATTVYYVVRALSELSRAKERSDEASASKA